MIKRIISLVISLALLLTGSACAAAESSPEESTVSVTVSSTLDESSPVESQAVVLSAGGAFTDVTPGDWFYEAVEYCREHGLMSGKGASKFAPNDNMTRAELATVLYRHAKSPAVTSSPDFIDVQADTWYTKAVAWAQENNIISGYGNGRFGTNDNVRREDIATIFWRYAGSPEVGKDAGFSDMSEVSGYALEAVDWARANNIVSGKGDNRFDPKGYATRAEVATMLMNFSKYTPDVPPSPSPDSAKILVAYFSATGTTRPLAGYAAEHLSADIYEITPQEPYTEEDLAYYTDCRADREQNDPSARPAISGGVEDMGQYDVVFIGYPIWHGQAPRIISTFLESYDFTGKTIVPFCTSHSSGTGSSATNLHELTGGAKWLDGKRFASGTSREEIESWVDGLDLPTPEPLPYDGIFPQHEPMGEGIGAMPGRVVWAHDPNSVEWDGSGYWWELSHFDEAVIQSMVDESIASLGGKSTAKEGWQSLFAYKGEGGYQSGEKIAIKANINGSAVMDDDTSGETAMSYTNPVLLKALLTSLVKEAGVAPVDITVYDVSRLFPDYMVELCTQDDLAGVNFVGRNNGVTDENAPIIWSHEFSGRVNYLPTCVTEAKYVINLANLKGHSYGITLCGKNHFGSFINGNSMRPPEGANLHQWLTRDEMDIYSPLTDLMANADLGGKTVLYMLDALICAPSEGFSITKENAAWQQAPFNGGYTASVFVSQDPVAIDSVGADFLSNEPAVTQYNRAAASANNENYLHESGLVGNAPSGTTYSDSRGHAVTNLGVHEHWNNSTEKKYSRNLGKDGGIELIQVLQ